MFLIVKLKCLIISYNLGVFMTHFYISFTSTIKASLIKGFAVLSWLAFTMHSVHCTWSPSYWDTRRTLAARQELPFRISPNRVPSGFPLFAYMLEWFIFDVTGEAIYTEFIRQKLYSYLHFHRDVSVKLDTVSPSNS
jgi:hypothetical protein